MKKVFSIAYYTFIESVRNRVFYVLVLFGVVLVFSALLLSVLGGEQQQRVLLNLGLVAMEFFAILTVCYGAVTLVLEEMESKTIYLVLSRPVPRSAYIAGRYLGLLLAVYLGFVIMSSFHVALLFAKKWVFAPRYVVAVLLSAEKITILGSVALFFSLFSTSAVSSISFTFFFWVLGHFSEEMSFLAGKLSNIILAVVFKTAYYVFPNFQCMNLKDFWDVPNVMGGWIVYSFGYGFLYCAVFFLLSVLLFAKKEF
ncbi:MAG: ABC transporter permease subunit [Endomicrobiales bacterium]|nr:ABC transporter permease subunit [Endomicrobiales bacterium]